MSLVRRAVSHTPSRSTRTAPPPANATGVVASQYGWGAIPMLTVYSAELAGEDGQLPVLPWNVSL